MCNCNETQLTSTQGPQGPTGIAGNDGEDGNTILNGTTNPGSGVGVDGDFYINTTNPKTIFGPKTAGAWGSGTSLIGPTGATGATGATGSAGATGSTGAAGDDGVLFQNIPIYGTTTRHFEATALSVYNAFSFIYPGSTNHKTPIRVKLIAFGATNVTQGRVTILDDTNSIEWIGPATFTPGNINPVIVDLGIPTNISTGQSLMIVSLEGITAAEKLTVLSMFIEY